MRKQYSKMQEIRELFTFIDGQGNSRRVVAMQAVGPHVYVAAGITPKDGGPEAVGGVVVINIRLAPYDGHLLSYKAMSEEEGPNYWQCPIVILDRLTATDSYEAEMWRKRCRDRATGRASDAQLVAEVQAEINGLGAGPGLHGEGYYKYLRAAGYKHRTAWTCMIMRDSKTGEEYNQRMKAAMTVWNAEDKAREAAEAAA